jgi:octaprenyl-diphosphate synthase
MLELIIQSVRKELEAFERAYSEALYAPAGDFRFMIDFVSAKKGKRIRPLLVILSAKMCGDRLAQAWNDDVPPRTLTCAVILELLHTATLIHDDVVDDTRERRGQPSVMARFDNHRAVLLGDYFLTQAIVQGVATDRPDMLRILARLAQNLVEGELSQLAASAESSIDEQRYFDVIRKKTALLLAACAEMGALSVDADEEEVQTLRTVGLNLGLCFQLRDDVFDYFEQGELGKPTGNDLREGKITLPLIYALRTAPAEQSAPLMDLVRKQDFSTPHVHRLIDFAKQHHGIEYAYQKMQEIKAETLLLLHRFPDSEARTALLRMIDCIIEREK